MTLFFKSGALVSAAMFVIGAAQAGQFTVETGKTKPIRLSQDAGSVVLGNQNIADVAVHDKKLILVSGKSFGTTNLIVFDREGKTIYSADLVVTANSANLVSVNRAGEFYTLNCSPNCRDTMQVGDENGHFNEIIQQLERQKDLND